ncbi:unnamed protein product [Moneuplotes crassus]|uniref:Uncharacterized protein n=1 Tax=Euplotes crassus TaxID=5936 RepID=A0AAD1UG83_EUPCR|nr:unnamed protein product [Moneuplotes crassus]
MLFFDSRIGSFQISILMLISVDLDIIRAFGTSWAKIDLFTFVLISKILENF